MFIFDYFRKMKTIHSMKNGKTSCFSSFGDESLSGYTKIKIYIEYYHPVSWITEAEGLIKFDKEEVLKDKPENGESAIFLLRDLEESLGSFDYSFYITKPFEYRKPILFISEIWHEMELEEYNKRLKKLACRKHFAKK